MKTLQSGVIKMNVKLKESDIGIMIRCAENGLDQNQTADVLNVSPATISRNARRFGIKFKTVKDRTCDKCGVNGCVCKTAETAKVDDREVQKSKQTKLDAAIRGNPRAWAVDKKKHRKEAAIAAIQKETRSDVIKEIAYAWNVLEFEIEMAKSGKRPALPMQIKTPNKQQMQKEKTRLLKISEDRRHHIISFFEVGKDYTVPELKNIMGDDNMGMNASVISGLMNGLVQMGRLKKYRLDYQKNKPDYWLYYLPNQKPKERTHD